MDVNEIKNIIGYECGTKNKRSDVVDILGEKTIRHIYEYADVFHSEQIAAVADRFIREFKISNGSFDNINDCKYKVPDYYMTPQYLKVCYEEGEILD